MQGPESGNIQSALEEIFSKKIDPLHYEQHPSDEILSSYLKGRLPKGLQDPETALLRAKGLGQKMPWLSNEVTTHLLTCLRCKQRYEIVREEASAARSFGWGSLVERLITGIRQQLNPVPRPALATMAVQFFIIAGLGAWILAQPAVSNTAITQANSLTAASGMTAIPDPGPVFSPTDLSSFSSLDEQARIRIAKEWGQSGDTRMMEPLANLLIIEQSPDVRQELWNSITSQLNRTQGQLIRTMQQIQNLITRRQTMGDYPSPDELNDLTKSFNQIFNQFENLDLRNELVYCELTSNSLSMQEMTRVAADTGAIISVEPSGPENMFTVKLPAIDPTQALRQIESRLGFSCGD